MAAPWLTCATAPADHRNVARLNDNEFITSTRTVGQYGLFDIQKYNIHTNEWKLMLTAEPFGYVAFGSMLFQKNQNKLYMQSRNYGELVGERMLIINLNTNQFTKLDLRSGFGLLGAMVNVNGIIHAIGDPQRRLRKHLAWNTNTNTNIVTEIFDFHEYFGSIAGASMIYVKSKQMILLIGGRDHCSSEKYIGIWRFCLKTKKWKRMIQGNECKWYCVCALSANENYVIISPDSSGKMYVLTIENRDDFKLNICKIISPGIDGKIIRMGNVVNSNLLISSWIRKLFTTSEFEELILPPKYLMELIGLYYEQEMIHWMGDSHYSIKLKDILKSAQ
eukprot:370815_1